MALREYHFGGRSPLKRLEQVFTCQFISRRVWPSADRNLPSGPLILIFLKMPVLITYDIERTTSTIHTEVKDAMKVKGYADAVALQSGSSIKLPNTTLVKHSIKPVDAMTDLKAVCKAKNATLERYVALNFTYDDWRAEDLKK